MGGVPKKHHSKSKVGRRRSQLALKKRDLVKCKQCNGPSFPHRACMQCGFYPAQKPSPKGKVVEDKNRVEAREESKNEAGEEKTAPTPFQEPEKSGEEKGE